MFAGWQTFYQTTGEAAAALIGLLFLVVTLTAGRDPSSQSQGIRLFSTPTVVGFATVLLASAFALAPPPHDAWSARAILLAGLVAAGYGLRISIGLHRSDMTVHWSDFWFYGAASTATCLALAGAGAAVLAGFRSAQALVALAVLALLMLAIRNAWDLITWLAPRRKDE